MEQEKCLDCGEIRTLSYDTKQCHECEGAEREQELDAIDELLIRAGWFGRSGRTLKRVDFLSSVGQKPGWANETFRWIPREIQVAIEQMPKLG